MNIEQYSILALRTAATASQQEDLQHASMGIAGEAGEVVDLLKKHLGHGHPVDREKLKKELGDVLWYLSDLARLFDIKLSDVAEANIEKLKRRYPNGFSKADSLNRGAE
jgi:NTP pyrophosphatase (non-canonical NTP hydrolase)